MKHLTIWMTYHDNQLLTEYNLKETDTISLFKGNNADVEGENINHLNRLTFANLNAMSKDSECIDKEMQQFFIGGGNGTIDSPYTWDEFLALDTINDCYYLYNGVTKFCIGEFVCSDTFSNTYLGVTEDPWSNTSDSSYQNTWTDLTPQERAFIIENPSLAYEFMKNASEANEVGENNHNGHGDALRHAYWSALNQMSAGYDSGDALRFGQCHECVSSQPNEEKEMDLHNNSVGFEYGRKAIMYGWSKERLLMKLRAAADRGELKMLE